MSKRRRSRRTDRDEDLDEDLDQDPESDIGEPADAIPAADPPPVPPPGQPGGGAGAMPYPPVPPPPPTQLPSSPPMGVPPLPSAPAQQPGVPTDSSPGDPPPAADSSTAGPLAIEASSGIGEPGLPTRPNLADHTSAAGPDQHLDEAASAWVLRRAIQLADEELLAAAKYPVTSLDQVAAELHVPVAAVADALAEYRAGATERLTVGDASLPSRSVLDRLVGPGVVSVRSRTGLGEEQARDNLSRWLKRRHGLRSRVTSEGTVVAVRRRGVMPAMIRSVRSVAGRSGLSGVKEVRGVAITGEPGRTSLCVVADVRDHRVQSLAAGSAVALGGTAVATTVAAFVAPVTIVAVPVALGAGWVVSWTSHRHRLRQVTEEVELTADQVAAGAEAGTIVDEIGRRVSDRRSRSKRSRSSKRER